MFIAIFSTTDCSECLSDMGFWNKLYAEFRHRGVDFLAVSCYSTPAETRRFIASAHLALPVACDEGCRLANWLTAWSTPVKFVVDPSGAIARVQIPSDRLTERRRQYAELRALLYHFTGLGRPNP